MTSAIGATDTTTQPASGATPKAPEQLESEETFLKLLVAQIRNQDPMQPADGLQFVSELSQFSQLEQLMEMNKDLAAIRQQLTQESAGKTGQTAP
jgi:flagellar basal-body rod modification protein FlgD